MDNITHTLVGLMLSRAGGFNSNKVRGEKGASVAIMLAANAPDMDTYNFFNDSLTYLQVHRGYTHALPFAPLVALVPLLLVKAFTRTRLTLLTLATYAGCLIAVLSHLLLDWTNVYGIRLMLPFNAKWYRLDSTDIIDPVILGILLLALAAPALSGLVASEMGGRKRKTPGRGWARVRFAGSRACYTTPAAGWRMIGRYPSSTPILIAALPPNASAYFPCVLPSCAGEPLSKAMASSTKHLST